MSKLAIHGGTPVRDALIHARWPEYGAADGRRLIEVLESRAWGGYPEPSPKTAVFAEAFANYHGADHGVLCVNGSVSLEMALVALDLEFGDEVIVPSYTWIATGACAVHVNAVPVFVDVDPDTYCMDPAAVEAAITPRTRAVIPVHLGAGIADLDRLTEICQRHDLALIEDCAHGHGAKWRGRGVGSWGDVGSFSFQVSKLMTCGEGGALITTHEELAARLHWIVNCGRKEPGFDGFGGTRFGINGRVSEFQAAVLQGQLERLEAATRQRDEAMAYMRPRLAEIGGLTPLKRDERITSQSAYQWIFKYDPEHFAGVHRDVVLRALAAEGVSCDGDFYVPMHEHELFTAESRHWPALRERYGDGFKAPETQAALDFPVTTKAAYEEAVWMHYPYLMGSRADLDAILEAIAKVKAHATELV
jgi:dTDP-4-amino-4,6-dideoxygalactose transaminase